MFIYANREAVEVVQGAIRECNLQLQVVQNVTSEIIDTLDSLKKRQALAAAIQVFQLVLFLGYLFTLAILYAVKKCKKNRAALIESEVKMMEHRLQDRKARRRAAAAKKAREETQ